MIDQNKAICPVCGSSAVESEIKATEHVFPGGGHFSVDEVLNRCSACGEEGDFAGVNDKRVDKALEIFRKGFSSDLIQKLATRNISMAWIERCLALPQRTLHRWKNGSCTASDLALLRIIDTFPWILDVAKQGFSPRAAYAGILLAAGGVVQNMVSLVPSSGLQCYATYSSDAMNASVLLNIMPQTDPNNMSKLLQSGPRQMVTTGS